MMERVEPRRMEKSRVLILGGGLAGMYAAISAWEAGCRPRILSKGRVGGSGSSLVSMSVHRFAPEEAGAREDYRRRFLASGAGEQDLTVAEILVEQGAEAVESLRRFGLPLEYRQMETASGPRDYLACCRPKQGRILTGALRDYLTGHTDVVLEEGVMAFDLVVSHGQIDGVLAERNGEICYYPADAVVLATGGAGKIYRYTSNTTDLTGDGYAMAFRAGLSLVGMEFVQFYPYRIFRPRRADIFPDIFSHGAVYRDRQGERFMERYPMKELENRDVLAREIYRRGGAFLDLSACDWTYLRQECPNIADMAELFPGKKLEVRPAAHFFMGGIPLRPDCSTEIGGLFACGEVTGGLHGANRLSGSALTEVAVFGPIAGCSAASWTPGPKSPEAESRALHSALMMLNRADGNGSLPDCRTLQELMWADASVERTKAGLRALLDKVSDLEEDFLRSKPYPLRRWLEYRNLLAVSRTVAEAALARDKSLGAHAMIS